MADHATTDGDQKADAQNVQELTNYIQTLLQQMQDKFQSTSDQIIGRIDQMGQRIDDLEKNIADLMTQAGVDEKWTISVYWQLISLFFTNRSAAIFYLCNQWMCIALNADCEMHHLF